MRRRSTVSLAARLTRMNLLVSGIVLLMAAVAFFSYNLFSFRHSLIRNLDAEAQIVGENSVSALTFNDRQSATTTLESLQSLPDVLGAMLVANDRTVFARFGISGQGDEDLHRLADGEIDHIWSSGTQVMLAHRIIFQGKPVGIVYISATLTEISQRVRQYLLITGIILIFCMAAAVFISSISRRLIAKPIIALADTALRVSGDQDYSARANIHTNEREIAVLINAFNTMLAQIQERDAALKEAHTGLEVRVAERTAELQAANRELEAFSYTVAHDLRGPLDAINGIVFLLTQSYSNSMDQEVHAMLAQLKTSTTNMGSLIDDLLNFARASTQPIKLTPVDLSAMVREIAAELTTSDPTRQVNFVIAEVPKVLADAGLLHIVLDNLLRNSWKYTSHHDHASIEFGVQEGSATHQIADTPVYFVRDDGAGFDPGRMGQLFQPFQRLHSKGDFPGTGIGLATVRRILARQGGSIWAEGAIDKGATFYFTINH